MGGVVQRGNYAIIHTVRNLLNKFTHMKNRFLSGIFLLVPFLTFAETWHDETTGLTWTYTVTDGKSTIENHPEYTTDDYFTVAVFPRPTGKVTIPNALGGYPVVSIGRAAFITCDKITEVEIPLSATNLGANVFHACDELCSVKGADNIKSIGKEAFLCCVNLTELSLPTTLISIGDSAFLNCFKLPIGELPSTLKDIGAQAFSSCSAIGKNLIIPGSVTNIGRFAFSDCTNLSCITIQEGVKEIGSGAFQGDTGLTCVKLPATLTYYANSGQFSGCSNIRIIVAPSLVPIRDAFPDSYQQIEKITIPNGVCEICDSAFWNCYKATSITIPNSVTNIGQLAFHCCSNLTEVEIPEVETIRYGTFCGCERLAKINIPDSVTCIEEVAFGGCSNLVNVSIPTSVTNRCYEAFKDCFGVRNVSVPQGIGGLEYVFRNAQMNITNVVIKDGASIISSMLFNNCSNLVNISIPKSVNEIGLGAFMACTSLKSVTLPNIQNVSDSMFCSCQSIKSIIIPPGVTNIGANAFLGCSSLEDIIIPSSVISIGGGAFDECNAIRRVTIPSTFGMHIFPSHDKITDITISEGSTNIGVCFVGCKSLISLSLPQSVETIEKYAFEGCESLRSLRIPRNVKQIKQSAFNGCASLQWLSFDGPPPVGLKDAGINANTLVWYNADYASEWTDAIAENGFTKTMPFLPDCNVTPSGTLSTEVTNIVCMTITNIVVHYVMPPPTSEVQIPSPQETGFVAIVTEIKGGAVSIPSEWKKSYPEFDLLYGGDLAKALTMKTGKRDGSGRELFVWQDYVAGTDPTKIDDVFTASISFINGYPVITCSPELSEEAKALRKYTVLGKRRLQDTDWREVTEDCEDEYNFFKVTVELR